MASETDICNRALMKVGAARIQSLTDQSVNARACSAAYPIVRDMLLRSHPWSFAIQRFELAASATPPAFGKANAFPLPTGWMRVLPPDPRWNINNRDWTIESGSILTDDQAPLYVRCVMQITDTTQFDPAFCEAVSAHLGMELAEPLTQSNEKKQWCAMDAKASIARAKKVNSIEQVPALAPEDDWITARLTGGIGYCTNTPGGTE